MEPNVTGIEAEYTVVPPPDTVVYEDAAMPAVPNVTVPE